MTEIFPRFSLPAVNFKNRKNRIYTGLYVKYFVLQEKFRDEQDEGKYITTLYINLQRLWRNLGWMT